MDKQKKLPLSIYLLRDSVKVRTDAIKKDAAIDSEVLLINDFESEIFFKKNYPHPPAWIKVFKKYAKKNLDSLVNSGTGAALIFTYGGRFFALTFGYGRYLLNQEIWEENFGLKVVLNSVNPEKIRSVDAQRLDATPTQSKTQANVATVIDDFGLDLERDLIRAATGITKEKELGGRITGKDSLRISIPFDLADCESLAEKLLELYSSEEYLKEFSWIDKLSEVRNPILMRELDQALLSKILDKNFDKSWLVVPDIIEWEKLEGFVYPQGNKKEPLDDISWESYLASLNDDVTLEQLKTGNVIGIASDNGLVIGRWSIYKCIYCEIAKDGYTHILNAGTWYQVESNFLALLDDAVKKMSTSTIKLPDYHHKSEAEYNSFVCDSDALTYFLMDQKFVHHGGGKSKIEVCDILSKDRDLIHVKRYSGSSALSHLFSQGLVSTTLLLSDSSFRNKTQKLLPSTFNIFDDAGNLNAKSINVVYGIATNGKENFLELPLFSKITLRSTLTQLDLMGVSYSLSLIKVI